MNSENGTRPLLALVKYGKSVNFRLVVTATLNLVSLEQYLPDSGAELSNGPTVNTSPIGFTTVSYVEKCGRGHSISFEQNGWRYFDLHGWSL